LQGTEGITGRTDASLSPPAMLLLRVSIKVLPTENSPTPRKMNFNHVKRLTRKLTQKFQVSGQRNLR